MAAAARCAPAVLLERWLLAGPPDRASSWRLRGEGVGCIGEELAARWLRARGLRILGRNVAAPEGELDLLAIEGDDVVVVEVKTGWRPAWAPENSRWRPALRLREVSTARRSRAAARLGRRMGRRARVDLVEVHALAGERRVRVTRWTDVGRPSGGRPS